MQKTSNCDFNNNQFLKDNQDNQAYLYISPLVTHFKSYTSGSPKKGGGKRSDITIFSAASRRRLISFLFSLEKSPDVMVTLTYPDRWESDCRKWKRDLDVFLKRVSYKFPDYWFVWKLEFQKRGAPHFHLLGSFGGGVVVNQALREWVSRAWYEVVGSGDEKHLKAGTNVEVLDSNKKVRAYVCKYIAKEDVPKGEDGKPIKVGRWWGKSGNVPAIVKIAVRLNYNEWVLVKRLVKRWVKAQARQNLQRWLQLPLRKRGSIFRGFKFWKWLKKFYRANWYIYIDMVAMVRILKAVCGFVLEFRQIRPYEMKFVL